METDANPTAPFTDEPFTDIELAPWREIARLGSTAGEMAGEDLRRFFAAYDKARFNEGIAQRSAIAHLETLDGLREAHRWTLAALDRVREVAERSRTNNEGAFSPIGELIYQRLMDALEGDDPVCEGSDRPTTSGSDDICSVCGVGVAANADGIAFDHLREKTPPKRGLIVSQSWESWEN